MSEQIVIINRTRVKCFLKEQLKSVGMERPEDISEDALVECFSRYIESDYYEWFKDNFRSFFETGYPFNYQNPDWNIIREMVKNSSQE